MSEKDTFLSYVRGAAAALERARQRIDDLNVYPVPDGDTGTNLALTARAAVEALETSNATDRATLARELARAALMGARGNSGVILSQIVRGAVDVLAEAEEIDADVIARALRSASDAAYRAVRKPVEGTMLTVIRELAEEAEARSGVTPTELLKALVRRGEEAVARTPEQLEILREAGVVDAGGAGVLEILRGLAAVAAGEPLPEPVEPHELPVEAVHQELSRYRYCTVFVIEGEGSIPSAWRTSSSRSEIRCSSSGTRAQSRRTCTRTIRARRSASARATERSRGSRSRTCIASPPSARTGCFELFRRRRRRVRSSPSWQGRATVACSRALALASSKVASR